MFDWRFRDQEGRSGGEEADELLVNSVVVMPQMSKLSLQHAVNGLYTYS